MTHRHLAAAPPAGPSQPSPAARPALPARTVQQHLAVLGLMRWSDVTGRFDATTAQALARFQASTHLPVDGVADVRTSDTLLARATAPHAA